MQRGFKVKSNPRCRTGVSISEGLKGWLLLWPCSMLAKLKSQGKGRGGGERFSSF